MFLRIIENVKREIGSVRLTDGAYRRLLIFCAALVMAGTVTAVAGAAILSPSENEPSIAAMSILITIPRSRLNLPWDITARTYGEPTYEDPKQDPTEELVPDGAKPVIKLTMTPSSSSEHYGEVYVRNEAGKKYDAKAMLESNLDISLNRSGSVQVLIYHTHGTEAYNDDGHTYYGDKYYSTRSKDTQDNVVHIGDVLAQALTDKGIGVVHDRTMYDDPQYTGAYLKSAEGIKKYLAAYPTLTVVIDLHRDTIVTSSGTKYRPVAETKYGTASQIMLIAACGKVADQNPHWKDNFKLTLHLQRSAANLFPDLMRPILLRNSMYNQHLSVGAFLAEVGTCGNTLTEAENAAKCLADIIENALVK